MLLKVDKFVVFEVKDIKDPMSASCPSVINGKQHKGLVSDDSVSMRVVESKVLVFAVIVCSFEVAEHLCLSCYSDHKYFG